MVHGSLVNLVNLDNMVKLISYNLDPRLRRSRTSLAGPADPWACHAVAYEMSICLRLLAVYVCLLANIGIF